MRHAKPLLFALLCLIWGSTWLVIKVGYGNLGPFNVAAWRFLLAGLLILPIGFALRVRWPSTREEWGLVAFVGVLLFGFDYGLIYWGELVLESGFTAVLFAVLPILTVFAAHLYLPAERLTARKLAGTTLAFIGVATLFADRIRVEPHLLLPMLAILGSAVCAACASVATKRHGLHMHPITLNGPAMLVGAAVLVLLSFTRGDGFALPNSTGVWGGILYLAIAGSIVTFLIYFHLLKTWQATSMSFVAVFTPVVALVLGFFVLDERPGAFTALGAVLILAGVVLATTVASSHSPRLFRGESPAPHGATEQRSNGDDEQDSSKTPDRDGHPEQPS